LVRTLRNVDYPLALIIAALTSVLFLLPIIGSDSTPFMVVAVLVLIGLVVASIKRITVVDWKSRSFHSFYLSIMAPIALSLMVTGLVLMFIEFYSEQPILATGTIVVLLLALFASLGQIEAIVKNQRTLAPEVQRPGIARQVLPKRFHDESPSKRR
jgi:hypothetical protein